MAHVQRRLHGDTALVHTPHLLPRSDAPVAAAQVLAPASSKKCRYATTLLFRGRSSPAPSMQAYNTAHKPGLASAGDVLKSTRAPVGLVSPCEISDAANGIFVSPCTTSAGELSSPQRYLRVEGSRHGSQVLRFIGMTGSRAVAFVDATRTLLIGEDHFEGERIVAVDADSRIVRWRGPPAPGIGGSCKSIAVLPNAGVCVAALSCNLIVVRLSDGALMSTTEFLMSTYVAASPQLTLSL